jgi:hypothetical protein
MEAGWIIQTAVVIALVSALIGYGSGRRLSLAVGYFLGTGAMIGVAFALAVATLFTFCGQPDC